FELSDGEDKLLDRQLRTFCPDIELRWRAPGRRSLQRKWYPDKCLHAQVLTRVATHLRWNTRARLAGGCLLYEGKYRSPVGERRSRLGRPTGAQYFSYFFQSLGL